MAESTKSGTGGPKAGSRPARIVEILAAAALFGGLLATGAIAQVAFGTPEILSHEQAGRLMAEVFERSVAVEAALVGAIALAALAARAWRRASVALLLALLVGAHFGLQREMSAIRTTHAGSLASLAADHPDRRQFGALHGIYMGVSISVLALAGGLLVCHALRREE